MSSIRRHPRNPKTWQVRYRDPAGKERSKTFNRKVDAEKFGSTVETDKVRGQWTDPRLGNVTFVEWAEEVMESRISLAPSTIARDQSLVQQHLLPHLGEYRLAAVKPMHIQQWITVLSMKYAPATVRKAHQLANLVFQAAVESDMLLRSPCRNISLPRDTRKEMRFLSSDEIEQLVNAVDERYQVLVLMAAQTGMRWGELAGLRIDNLDMLRRRVTVVESLVEVRGKLHTGPPKTSSSRRTIALPTNLVGELAHQLAKYPPVGGYLFTTPTGLPLRRTNFRRRVWLPAVRASVGEPCRFHDLRHSHVALLIDQGIHIKVIQERLGHASVRTTLDVYGHLFEGLDEAAADAIDTAFGSRIADKTQRPADISRTSRVTELTRQ